MHNFLNLFTNYNDYTSYTKSITREDTPQVCYLRNAKMVSYFPIVSVVCENSVTAETYQISALIKGKNKNNITYALVGGEQYASVSSGGVITIKNGANDSKIAVAAIWEGMTGVKQLSVTYLSGSSVETETDVVENPDGSVIKTTTTTTTNADGSSSENVSSTTTDENGNITETVTSEIETNSDGSSTESTTTTTYDSEGNVEGTTTLDKETATDGSFTGVTNTYDSEGDITGTINQNGDEHKNINTQTIAYEDGEPIVTGYSIDTSQNTGGTESINGEEVNTEYYAFDATHAFELMIHFYYDPSKQGSVNQATILNAKRADPEPWYGFDLRRNGTTNNIQYGAQFSTGSNNRANITMNSNKIYKIQVNYNPTATTNSFIMRDLINNKDIINSNGKFPDLPELQYLKITIGCALDASGNPQRRAVLDVYEFYVRRLD